MKKHKHRHSLVIAVCILMAVAAAVCQTYSDIAGVAVSAYNSGFPELILPGLKAGYTAAYDDGGVSVTTPQGYEWASAMAEEQRAALSRNRLWQDYMAALVTVNCYDATTRQTEKLHSSSAKAAVDVQYQDDEAVFSVSFPDYELAMKVRLFFEGGVLRVRIPAADIQEGKRYLLMSVEVMPFLGAADASVDGYIFFPDGSGTLMRYQNTGNRPTSEKSYTYRIGGSSPIQYADDNTLSAQLPIYGIKNGGEALLAVITAGAAESNIDIRPSGYVLAAHRVCFEMCYRYTYEVAATDIQTKNSDSVYVDVNKDMQRQDFEAHYFFLSGEEANYSAMARTYRAFLLANDGLMRGPAEACPAMIVDFLVGDLEKGAMTDREIIATSYAQIADIAKDLRSVLPQFALTLSNWQREDGKGRHALDFAPWSGAGGKAGFADMLDSLRALEIPVYLSKEFAVVPEGAGGFSDSDDAACSPGGLPYSSNGRMLARLATQKSIYQRFEDAYAGRAGVLFSFGGALSSNYLGLPYTRTEAAEANRELMRRAHESGGAAVCYDSMTSMAYVDLVVGLPERSSRSTICDAEVPFLQMVLHGSVPYASGAVNLYYDADMQTLKMLEYGAVPYYRLTEQSATALKYTGSNALFSSEYAHWAAHMREMAALMEEFAPVRTAAMVGHEAEAEGRHVTVRYDNGYSLYINYGSEPWLRDGVTVDARSYALLGE